MKYALCAAVMLAAMTTTADASPVRWESHFLIKERAGNCPDYNPVGTRGQVHFEPEIANSDNGPGSSFVLYEDLWSKGYRLQGRGVFSRTFKDVDTIYASSDFGPDTSAQPQVRFKSQVPTRLTASVEFINVVAEIKNYDRMPGCVVTVYMALIQRIVR